MESAKLHGRSRTTPAQGEEREAPWKVVVNPRAIKEEKEILGGLIGWLATRWGTRRRRGMGTPPA